jgi:hypothetical protein
VQRDVDLLRAAGHERELAGGLAIGDGAAVALSPGTADATTRLPGPRRSTTAGLLTIHGAVWKWRPIADID